MDIAWILLLKAAVCLMGITAYLKAVTDGIWFSVKALEQFDVACTEAHQRQLEIDSAE